MVHRLSFVSSALTGRLFARPREAASRIHLPRTSWFLSSRFVNSGSLYAAWLLNL
jgi:hypothetical protein